MKDINNNLKETLKDHQVMDKMPEKEAFWKEFHSRAQSVPQDEPGIAQQTSFMGSRYLKIAACFFLIAVVIWGYTVYNGPGRDNNDLTGQPVSVIENYEFFTPNHGVMIWQDNDNEEQTSATILWVIDTDESVNKDEKNET